ncbi:MAG: hypothetical protein IH905_02510 [Proteobacteria bacterium]|nr:hypothetical protein [Pseudomonadota bacterium]
MKKFSVVLVGSALVLMGCSTVSDAIFPGSEESTSRPTQTATVRPAPARQSSEAPALRPTPPPTLGNTTFRPLSVTPGEPTGTFVGQRIAQLRNDLGTLQRNIGGRNQQLQNIRNQTMGVSQRYHGTVAAISTRLQMGTTPGNPVLIDQWNAAQGELDALGGDIAQMNSLANIVAADSAFAAFLLESTRATFGLAGAIDEDHRQLAILEDETNRTVVLIDRLLNELSEDVSRQTAYVGNERSNLTTLSLAIKNGELLGSSLANRAFRSAAPIASRAPLAGSNTAASSQVASIAGRRPLVVIRFDRPNVPFEQALYTAVSQALDTRAGAQFDLVAVTPSGGSPADLAINSSKSKKNAESVLRALLEMGLPADRVALSASTSGDAFTNEVHIYVR